MAVDHRIIRNTENFRGLDLRSSDSSRSSEFSSGMKNAMYRVSGAINKRKGFKTLYNTNSLKGMTNFKNISKDGSVSDELIYVEENNVKKLVSFDDSFNVTEGKLVLNRIERKDGLRLAVIDVIMNIITKKEDVQLTLELQGEMVLEVDTLRDHSLVLGGKMLLEAFNSVQEGDVSYTLKGEGIMKGVFHKKY